MQTCNKCLRYLPFAHFHKHPGTKTGVRTICKDCACAHTRKYYSENREKHLKTCKEWQKNNPDKMQTYYERMKSRYVRKRRRSPENDVPPKTKNETRKKTYDLVYAGELVKSNKCQMCGVCNEGTEAHHYDYRNPKAVTWLCKPCHQWLHRKLRQNDVQIA